MPKKETTKLSAKFQICIPEGVRASQGWKAGQEFAFISKGEDVLLVPVREANDLLGLAKGARRIGYRDRTDRC